MKPEDAEIRTALREFLKHVLDKTEVFKIGRVKAADFDGLAARPMYDGAKSIEKLWQGPSGKVSWLEYALTAVSWKKYPARCLNEQRGGGPTADAADHILYIALFDPTIDRLADVFLIWALRELPPEEG